MQHTQLISYHPESIRPDPTTGHRGLFQNLPDIFMHSLQQKTKKIDARKVRFPCASTARSAGLLARRMWADPELSMD